MIELIDKFRRTEDFHGLGRVYRIAVPAFSSATILWECPQWKGFLLMYVREPFDHEVAIDVMRFTCRSWNVGIPENGMLVLPSRFTSGRTAMDSVVLLGSPMNRLIGEVAPSIDGLKVVAFPAYRCEFSGEESVELFETLIRTRSDISNWGRPCRPQLWVHIDAPQGLAMVSPVGRWSLTDLDVLKEEAARIARGGGSFNLRNFAGKVVSVSGGKGALLLKYQLLGGARTCPNWEVATAHLKPFVREDCWL